MKSARTGALARAGLALVVAVLAGAPGFAQQARKYSLVDTVTVVDVSPESHVLAARDREQEHVYFVVDEKTRIQRGAEEIAFEDLKEGDRVAVGAREPVPDVGAHPPIADVIIVVGKDQQVIRQETGAR